MHRTKLRIAYRELSKCSKFYTKPIPAWANIPKIYIKGFLLGDNNKQCFPYFLKVQLKNVNAKLPMHNLLFNFLLEMKDPLSKRIYLPLATSESFSRKGRKGWVKLSHHFYSRKETVT